MTEQSTALREAALRAALEALENTGDLWWNSKDEAISALRAALEQPEQVAWNSVGATPLAFETECSDGTRFLNVAKMPAHAVRWRMVAPPRREALEQPERAQQQRDAGYTRRPTLREMAGQEHPEQEPDRWGAGYEAGYAAGMAEMKPEQVPVAWLELRILSSGGYASPIKEWHVTQNPSTSNALRKPLYTHPPRREWRSLSKEEVDVVAAELGYAQLTPREVARAIEAKLKEKNHE